MVLFAAAEVGALTACATALATGGGQGARWPWIVVEARCGVAWGFTGVTCQAPRRSR